MWFARGVARDFCLDPTVCTISCTSAAALRHRRHCKAQAICPSALPTVSSRAMSISIANSEPVSISIANSEQPCPLALPTVSSRGKLVYQPAAATSHARVVKPCAYSRGSQRMMCLWPTGAASHHGCAKLYVGCASGHTPQGLNLNANQAHSMHWQW